MGDVRERGDKNTSWFPICLIKWLMLIFAKILEKGQVWNGRQKGDRIFFFKIRETFVYGKDIVKGGGRGWNF